MYTLFWLQQAKWYSWLSTRYRSWQAGFDSLSFITKSWKTAREACPALCSCSWHSERENGWSEVLLLTRHQSLWKQPCGPLKKAKAGVTDQAWHSARSTKAWITKRGFFCVLVNFFSVPRHEFFKLVSVPWRYACCSLSLFKAHLHLFC